MKKKRLSTRRLPGRILIEASALPPSHYHANPPVRYVRSLSLLSTRRCLFRRTYPYKISIPITVRPRDRPPLVVVGTGSLTRLLTKARPSGRSVRESLFGDLRSMQWIILYKSSAPRHAANRVFIRSLIRLFVRQRTARVYQFYVCAQFHATGDPPCEFLFSLYLYQLFELTSSRAFVFSVARRHRVSVAGGGVLSRPSSRTSRRRPHHRPRRDSDPPLTEAAVWWPRRS